MDFKTTTKFVIMIRPEHISELHGLIMSEMGDQIEELTWKIIKHLDLNEPHPRTVTHLIRIEFEITDTMPPYWQAVKLREYKDKFSGE